MYFVKQVGSQTMPIVSEEIYHSANGDRWQLIGDAISERLFVRHEANPSSGGSVTDMDVADFLNAGGAGPEYAALRDIMRRRQPASPIADRIRKIVAEHLKLADGAVTLDASFIDDLGADGVDVVEIVMSLEDAFGLEIPDDVAERIRSVKDAIDCVETQSTGG
jgi:acyl carrier protein